MDVGAAVVADEEPLELVEPGEGAFDDPAVATQPGAVAGFAAGDLRCDATLPQLTAVLGVVVAAVSAEPVGAPPRTADTSSNSRYCVEERNQLGDVVAVAARERPGERNPGRIDEEMMLGAVSRSINRARARRGAPFFACTWLESATARAHWISPAARNSASKSACSRCHTPARCHSSNRR
jgi:hypothetical protein